MDMSPREYQDYVKNLQKKSPLLKDMALAFAIGGAICVIGQLILNGWLMLLPQDDAATATSVSLVFLSALFTGLNLYNKLARFGGAGTLVPITGFANAVASPAIDFRAEGLVTGMAAKMFLIAGPVIVFGTAASVIYGVALWLLGGIRNGLPSGKPFCCIGPVSRWLPQRRSVLPVLLLPPGQDQSADAAVNDPDDADGQVYVFHLAHGVPFQQGIHHQQCAAQQVHHIAHDAVGLFLVIHSGLLSYDALII